MNIALFTHAIISIISLNWSVFTADVGGFSVLSPGELQLEVKNIPSGQGDIQWHNHSYHVNDSTQQVFLYSITHYDFIALDTEQDTTDVATELFAETIDAIVDRLQGELLYSQPEPFGDYPSQISRISYQEGQYSLKNKIILAKDKIYMIEVFSSYDGGLSYEVGKFIDSFTLLD